MPAVQGPGTGGVEVAIQADTPPNAIAPVHIHVGYQVSQKSDTASLIVSCSVFNQAVYTTG